VQFVCGTSGIKDFRFTNGCDKAGKLKKFLLFTISITISSFTIADIGAGKTQYEKSNCQACHDTRGPAWEESVDDQLSKKGPELWYAGSKFNRSWLETWLVSPSPIRPMQYNSILEKNTGDHVALDAASAEAIADYLMSLTSDAVAGGKIKPKARAKGKLIFKKKMSCNGCHLYQDRNEVIGGLSGPSLVAAGARLNPDWIYAYLTNPKVFKPIGRMPGLKGVMRTRDIKEVSSYISSF
jgi:mono/diheme cytochrome c family protein|tara:strand:+ start:32 stop:748 length:717 start_codon:yes stop_codon:yes gene_type:complete